MQDHVPQDHGPDRGSPDHVSSDQAPSEADHRSRDRWPPERLPPEDRDEPRPGWRDGMPPRFMHQFGIATSLALSLVALVLGQAAGVCAVTAMGHSLTPPGADDGAAAALFLIVSMPVQVITLVLAARMTDADLVSYLGFNLPTWREIEVAGAGLAILIVAGDVLTFLSGHDLVPAYDLGIHRTALAQGWLLALWFAIIVLLPVGEEMLLRSFLFRGFVRSSTTSIPGLLSIALIWTLLHAQYDDQLANVLLFLVGSYLGIIRLVSGSTTLVILLHVLWNLESILETVLALGWVF